jgi:hypothetical protein
MMIRIFAPVMGAAAGSRPLAGKEPLETSLEKIRRGHGFAASPPLESEMWGTRPDTRTGTEIIFLLLCEN